MNRLIFFALLLIPVIARAQNQRIGLWGGKTLSAASFKVSNGSYDLLTDGETKSTLAQGTTAKIVHTSSNIRIETGGKIFSGKKITFHAKAWNSEFHLTPENPKKERRIYQDDLQIRHRSAGALFINDVDLEKYVAGVVEAESGKDQVYEYYKVQAVICRSYVLANRNKHFGEDFHLCDEVHCQVFHGKSRWNDSIPLATYATKGHVLVDRDINLITAAFHSNCGGHTVNAETVWSRPLHYLIGKPDTFCLHSSQSHWEKEISAKEWRSYLEKTFKYNMNDSLLAGRALHYYPTAKSRFMMDDKLAISLVKIRNDWKLRSTFFIVHEEGEKVKLIGRGFGHGVGLCQEGAMQMCRSGYTYREVLHYYYTDVHLLNINQLGFFKE